MTSAAKQFAAQCQNHLKEAQAALERVFEASEDQKVLEEYNRLSIQIDNALARLDARLDRREPREALLAARGSLAGLRSSALRLRRRAHSVIECGQSLRKIPTTFPRHDIPREETP